MVVMNFAGYTFAFKYRGVDIIVPYDGKTYAIPDDIEIDTYPQLVVVQDEVDSTPKPKYKTKTGIHGTTSPSANSIKGVRSDIPLELRGMVINYKGDDNTKITVAAENLSPGYDDQLDRMVVTHLATEKYNALLEQSKQTGVPITKMSTNIITGKCKTEIINKQNTPRPRGRPKKDPPLIEPVKRPRGRPTKNI